MNTFQASSVFPVDCHDVAVAVPQHHDRRLSQVEVDTNQFYCSLRRSLYPMLITIGPNPFPDPLGADKQAPLSPNSPNPRVEQPSPEVLETVNDTTTPASVVVASTVAVALGGALSVALATTIAAAPSSVFSPAALGNVIAGIVGATAVGNGVNAAVMVLRQAQFISIAGRIGGSLARGSELSRALAWTNFHWFEIPNECLEMQNYLELGGTTICVLSCLIGIFCARELTEVVFRFWVKRKGGEPRQEPYFPFPSWEIKMFSITVLGLSESIFLAIPSPCPEYQAGGAIVLVFVSTILFLVLGALLVGVRRSCKYEFIGCSLHRTYSAVREAKAPRQGFLRWLLVKMQAYTDSTARGEWASNDEKEDPQPDKTGSFLKNPLSKFLERYGSVFTDTVQQTAPWFIGWLMFKDLFAALILGLIMDPLANVSTIFVVYALDCAIQLFWLPQVDIVELLTASFASTFRTVQVGVILASIVGTIDTDFFALFFTIFSLVTMVPDVFRSFVGSIMSFIRSLVPSEAISFLKAVQHDAGVGAVTGAYNELSNQFMVADLRDEVLAAALGGSAMNCDSTLNRQDSASAALGRGIEGDEKGSDEKGSNEKGIGSRARRRSQSERAPHSEAMAVPAPRRTMSALPKSQSWANGKPVGVSRSQVIADLAFKLPPNEQNTVPVVVNSPASALPSMQYQDSGNNSEGGVELSFNV
mmetsp:Transcript_39917/g.98089  ORF Transcript_39917/g.98089 Transcript_39917/m.98089 type:complete len:702 (-) Transcript_39917:99-2204(-)